MHNSGPPCTHEFELPLSERGNWDFGRSFEHRLEQLSRARKRSSGISSTARVDAFVMMRPQRLNAPNFCARPPLKDLEMTLQDLQRPLQRRSSARLRWKASQTISNQSPALFRRCTSFPRPMNFKYFVHSATTRLNTPTLAKHTKKFGVPRGMVIGVDRM